MQPWDGGKALQYTVYSQQRKYLEITNNSELRNKKPHIGQLVNKLMK